jgi:DNA-binding transcriptional ArsR family regulator
MAQEKAIEDLLVFFRALSDANRLKIVALLAREPRSVEMLAHMLGVSSSTVSHHLARLSKAGLVSARAEGYYSMYRLDPRALGQIAGRILSKEVLPAIAGDMEKDANDRNVLDANKTGEGRRAHAAQKKTIDTMPRPAARAVVKPPGDTEDQVSGAPEAHFPRAPEPHFPETFSGFSED